MLDLCMVSVARSKVISAGRTPGRSGTSNAQRQGKVALAYQALVGQACARQHLRQCAVLLLLQGDFYSLCGPTFHFRFVSACTAM